MGLFRVDSVGTWASAIGVVAFIMNGLVWTDTISDKYWPTSSDTVIADSLLLLVGVVGLLLERKG